MVDDIITEQAQATLVVESPHRDEVADGAGAPLSGDSGRVVSRVLVDVDYPVGPLCQDGQVRLSIVNTFGQPLQFDTVHEKRPLLLRKLNSVPYPKGRHEEYKDALKRILQECRDKHMVDDYVRRISTALAATPSKRLVICGLIAQSVFEFAFGVVPGRLARPFPCTVGSHEVQVFYVWHPSPRAGEDGISKWELPSNVEAINRLKSFASASTLLQTVRVEVMLDDTVPEDLEGIIRCGTVQSFDAVGRLKDHQDLVDNTEYSSRSKMISDVARRLRVPKDIIEIL